MLLSKYDKFYDYLSDLRDTYRRLADLLLEKLDAISCNDLLRIDEITGKEQAFVLTCKGFDANIKRFREQLPLSGETLSEVISNLPPEEQQRFADLLRPLKSNLDECQALNASCQGLMGDTLHKINRALEKTPGAGYGKAAPAANDRPQLFTKTV